MRLKTFKFFPIFVFVLLVSVFSRVDLISASESCTHYASDSREVISELCLPSDFSDVNPFTFVVKFKYVETINANFEYVYPIGYRPRIPSLTERESNLQTYTFRLSRLPSSVSCPIKRQEAGVIVRHCYVDDVPFFVDFVYRDVSNPHFEMGFSFSKQSYQISISSYPEGYTPISVPVPDPGVDPELDTCGNIICQCIDSLKVFLQKIIDLLERIAGFAQPEQFPDVPEHQPRPRWVPPVPEPAIPLGDASIFLGFNNNEVLVASTNLENLPRFEHKNVLKCSADVLSTKFPFALFDGISGFSAACPSVSFFQATYTFCWLLDGIRLIKYPVLSGLLIWMYFNV